MGKENANQPMSIVNDKFTFHVLGLDIKPRM